LLAVDQVVVMAVVLVQVLVAIEPLGETKVGVVELQQI
jgi:hypothetical protein